MTTSVYRSKRTKKRRSPRRTVTLSLRSDNLLGLSPILNMKRKLVCLYPKAGIGFTKAQMEFLKAALSTRQRGRYSHIISCLWWNEQADLKDEYIRTSKFMLRLAVVGQLLIPR